MESCFVEPTKVHKKVVQVWRSCTMLSKWILNTSWEIYQEVVWYIHNTINNTMLLVTLESLTQILYL
jgi:hypothetical protein